MECLLYIVLYPTVCAGLIGLCLDGVPAIYSSVSEGVCAELIGLCLDGVPALYSSVFDGVLD